jgi:hypothetical protein
MSERYRDAPTGKPKCLRCDVELDMVHVLDHIEGGAMVGLVYTIKPPDKSVWSGRMKNSAGVIRAYVCPKCQLVAWYASPGAEPETA